MLFLLTTITPYGYWDNGKPFSAPGISLVPALAGLLCPSYFWPIWIYFSCYSCCMTDKLIFSDFILSLGCPFKWFPICSHTMLLFHLTSVPSRYHHSYDWGKNVISEAYILRPNIKCMGPCVWNGTGHSLILSHRVGAMLDMSLTRLL